jgi:hypothetical protein
VTKREDLVGFLPFAEIGIGVAEDLAPGILGQKRQYGLAALAAAGHVVLLDDGIRAEVGDRVEVEVERGGIDQPLGPQPLDPRPQQAHDGFAAQARGVLRHVGRLGQGVEAHGEGHALVEEQIHDVTAAGPPEQLEDEGGPDGMGRRDHGGARELTAADHGIEVEAGQQGQEQKEPAGPSGEDAGGQGEGADIGDGVGRWPRAARALLIGAAGQPGKAFGAEHFLDGGDTELGRARPFQLIANVVDGEVALAERNDAGADRVLARLRGRPVRARAEEVAVHLVPEAPAEDAEGAGLVAEPEGDLGRWGPLGEISAQRLVLALAGLGRLQEEPGGICYRI